MNSRKFWNLAAAIAAALVVMAVLGREARAETLYTERPAELRSSPADDSQVIKRVGKGKSLEVVKRLGTWVMVKYEGRSGWIRRTSLSTDQVAGGGSDDGGDDGKDAKKKDRKKAEVEDDEDVAETPKPAAAGAKRTAARKKAERRKSRSKRRQMEEDEEAEEEVASKSKKRKKSSDDDEEEADEEEMTPRRPRSTWSKRSNLPGGPLKVEIQARSVQAFSQPDGSGRVVFTAAEGDSVRVIGKGENRWLLVENARKRQGWIPAVTVRDHGLLLDARKDSAELAEESSKSDDEEAPDAETEEVEETRTASADDSEDRDADEGSKSEDIDASLDSSSEDLDASKSPWIVGAALRAGFTTVGMDITPVGVMNPQEGAYNGPIAGLNGQVGYRLSPKLSAGVDVDYNYTNALSGLTFTNNGTEDPNKVKLSHHRIGARAGISYGQQLVGTFRAGFQYAALQVNDIANTANLPRETTSGPTVGLGVAYNEIGGSKFGVRFDADVLLLGSRSQTQGNRDGLELGSLTSFGSSLMLDYWLTKNLTIGGGYRFGYAKANWTGASERITGAMETDVKDQGHEISLGVGYQL